MERQNDFLKEVMASCHRAFMYVGFFSLTINILTLVVPLYMLQIYDRVLASHSYETLLYLTLIGLAALFVFGLLDIVRSNILVVVSHWLDEQLSPPALHRSPDELLSGNAYGSQALRDITTIRQFLGGAGTLALFDAPWAPIYLFVIFLLHPALGWMALIGLILLGVIAFWNERATREPLDEANSIYIQNQRQADSALRNAEVIQAMGMMSNIIYTWLKRNARVLALQEKASIQAARLLSLSKFLRMAIQVLMLGVGAYYVIQNELTGGAMIGATILLARAMQPVEQAIGTWKQLINTRQAYERLTNHFAKRDPRTANLPLPTPKGLLTVENVVYGFANQAKPILSGLSFEVPAGEMVAIIGPSGAGKSTLARLMVGVWRPNGGTVRLDSADVYTWNRGDFGPHVGYLPQDVELFPGTIKENIARMGEIDPKAVIEASQLAGVHDMILHFPEGYDTEIYGSGLNLSGGQRQRIALARTLYGNPRLLVLDEPNSNLDYIGEDALVKALEEMRRRGSTIILIAQRPSVIRLVDKVLILQDGHINAYGPRDEILKQLNLLPTAAPAGQENQTSPPPTAGDRHGNAPSQYQ